MKYQPIAVSEVSKTIKVVAKDKPTLYYGCQVTSGSNMLSGVTVIVSDSSVAGTTGAIKQTIPVSSRFTDATYKIAPVRMNNGIRCFVNGGGVTTVVHLLHG